MKFYESLVMMRSATTEAQVDELEGLLTKLVEQNQGAVARCDRWGKLKLAFPIEHKDYAYFVLIRFTVSDAKAAAFPQELDHLFKVKLNATVIRFVTLALTEEVFGAPYKKPEAFIPSAAMPGKGGFSSERGSFFKKSVSKDEASFEERAESAEYPEA